MSETANNSVLNGPTSENKVPFTANPENNMVSGINHAPTARFAPPGAQIRPLQRTDSRGAFPLRPPYPPRAPIHPLNRAGFPPGQPRPRPPIFLQNRPLPPNFRPPFNRPPFPPSFQQQRSVPAFGPTRSPSFEANVLPRSQTIDGDTPPKLYEHVPVTLPSEHLNPSLVNIGKTEPLEEAARPKMEEERPSSRMEKIVEGQAAGSEPDAGFLAKLEAGVDGKKEEVREVVKASLDLGGLTKIATPTKIKEGDKDNDSGVDESTQGNDQSINGNTSSSLPRKISAKTPSSPSKSRPVSRGSKSPGLKSPDSAATTPGSAQKKLPMNKVQVGSAPSPNLKIVRSKIGSLDNASYKPGGGRVKIESKKVDFKNATPRIEAKNERYTPRGSEKKIPSQKLQWNAKSKIGSLENAAHKPSGGDKKIESLKLDFKDKAKPKIGSKDNIKHVPGGGDVKIENRKLDIKSASKVGSFEKIKHKPGGGDKKIFDDKDYLKQMASTGENPSLSGSQNSILSQPDSRCPTADENLNQEH